MTRVPHPFPPLPPLLPHAPHPPPDPCPPRRRPGRKPPPERNSPPLNPWRSPPHPPSPSLLAAARIPKRYEHCELTNFEFDGPHRSLAPARMAACKFAEEYPLDATGLLLIGSIGVGKTHLAVGMIKELIQSKGIPCLFTDYRELLKQIQNSYNASVQATELDVLRPIFETEVLVLDELGAVKPTEWVWDTVSLILNTRYNQNRTTIITTNFANEPPHSA